MNPESNYFGISADELRLFNLFILNSEFSELSWNCYGLIALYFLALIYVLV